MTERMKFMVCAPGYIGPANMEVVQAGDYDSLAAEKAAIQSELEAAQRNAKALYAVVEGLTAERDALQQKVTANAEISEAVIQDAERFRHLLFMHVDLQTGDAPMGQSVLQFGPYPNHKLRVSIDADRAKCTPGKLSTDHSLQKRRIGYLWNAVSHQHDVVKRVKESIDVRHQSGDEHARITRWEQATAEVKAWIEEVRAQAGIAD